MTDGKLFNYEHMGKLDPYHGCLVVDCRQLCDRQTDWSENLRVYASL